MSHVHVPSRMCKHNHTLANMPLRREIYILCFAIMHDDDYADTFSDVLIHFLLQQSRMPSSKQTIHWLVVAC